MHIFAYMITEIEKYKAIGEETRLRILRILIKADEELCVCEIVDILKKPQYNISKSLGILKRATLLEERRDGKNMKYGLIKGNDLNQKLFESIIEIKCNSNEIFQDDFANLRQRINLRDKLGCTL